MKIRKIPVHNNNLFLEPNKGEVFAFFKRFISIYKLIFNIFFYKGEASRFHYINWKSKVLLCLWEIKSVYSIRMTLVKQAIIIQRKQIINIKILGLIILNLKFKCSGFRYFYLLLAMTGCCVGLTITSKNWKRVHAKWTKRL